jgi:hypothetical protein
MTSVGVFGCVLLPDVAENDIVMLCSLSLARDL